MPRIPIYDGPQVGQTVQRAPQESFQAQRDVSQDERQIASALGQAAQTLDRVVERDVKAAVYTADQEIRASWLQRDSELRKTYRAGNVDGYKEEVSKFWDETKRTYADKLDPMARSALGTTLGTARAMAEAGALKYYDTEKEVATVSAFEGAKAMSKQMALTDGSLPAIEAARVDLGRKNALEAARRGMTTEELQALNLRDMTALHSEFISTNAQKKPDEAMAYFDKYKDEIDGSRHNNIRDVLGKEITNKKAKDLADSLVSLPMEEQIAKVSAITDPDVRAKASVFMKENQSLVRQAQQDREKKFSDQAWQMVGLGQRVPESILANMDGKERVMLQDHLRQRAERQADRGNAPPKTDRATHAELWDLLVNDPEKFKTVRLVAYSEKLSQADLEQLALQQKGMLNPKKEKDVISFNNKVLSRLEMLGVASGAKDQEKRGMFRSAAQKLFEDFEARTGKPPSPEDEEKILDNLSMPGAAPWFGRNSPAKNYAEAVVTGKAFVPDIPKEDREAILAKAKARNVTLTDEQIQATFKLIKGIK